MPAPLDLLRDAYGALSDDLHEIAMAGEHWSPTGCRGWAVADLGHHLLSDARRALVALASPADRPADTDAVTYWRSWSPPQPDDEKTLRHTRAAASVGPAFPRLAELYAETTRAVVVAAGRVDGAQAVQTQGHVLAVDDLISTLVVEAAVHHLDLMVGPARSGPSAAALTEVRRILEGLLEHRLPVGWDDVTAARRGTGREPLTGADRAELGALAEAFPLFG